MVCALRIREVVSFSLEKEVYLNLTEVVEWMWIDANLQLFGLSLLIFITVEIISRLLGLVCWNFTDCSLQLLCLPVKWLLIGKKIKSRNRFGI